jgi:hypothetical protein
MTRASLLLDTGPLVALLHGDDREHDRCVETARRQQLPLLTTWAVVTEAMHLLRFSPAAQTALLELIQAERISVAPLLADDALPMKTLMERYADLPMDFADATLVHVANREGLRDIFTLDRRDFAVYRLKGGRSFNVVPRG